MRPVFLALHGGQFYNCPAVEMGSEARGFRCEHRCGKCLRGVFRPRDRCRVCGAKHRIEHAYPVDTQRHNGW